MPDSSSPVSGVREAVRSFSPAYFGMVMATGIVSIAAQLLGMSQIAIALFWLNIGAYLVLWLVNIVRVFMFTGQFFGDMVDHQRGPGFFTFVAGSCVLGSQFVLITENCPVAIGERSSRRACTRPARFNWRMRWTCRSCT